MLKLSITFGLLSLYCMSCLLEDIFDPPLVAVCGPSPKRYITLEITPMLQLFAKFSGVLGQTKISRHTRKMPAKNVYTQIKCDITHGQTSPWSYTITFRQAPTLPSVIYFMDSPLLKFAIWFSSCQ